MWLWSRPWPYSWLWGSGTDYQKEASLTVNVSASTQSLLAEEVGVGTPIQVVATYNISASTDDYDEVFLAWESPQVYYLSASAAYGLQADPNIYEFEVFVTAETVWSIQQAGVTAYSGSTTAQLSASASGVVAVSADASTIAANVTASVTDVSIAIFYGYSASVAANITASTDWSLDVTQAFVTKSFNNTYYVSASALAAINTAGNTRGKLVWSRKKGGYYYVATSA